MTTKSFKNQMSTGFGALGLAFAGMFFITACGDNDDSNKNPTKSLSKDLARASRTDAEALLSAQVSEMETRMSLLSVRIKDEARAETRLANEDRFDSLQASVNETRTSLKALKASSDRDWESQKAKTIKSVEKTRSKIDSTFDRLDFQEEVAEKLTKIEKKMDQLKADAAGANAKTRKEIEKSQEALEAQYAELKDDFEDFQKSSDDEWTQFKDRMSKSFSELSKGFKGLFD
jgi:chromosome segregation ATPase